MLPGLESITLTPEQQAFVFGKTGLASFPKIEQQLVMSAATHSYYLANIDKVLKDELVYTLRTLETLAMCKLAAQLTVQDSLAPVILL